MAQEIIVAIIGAIVAVVSATLTYFFTKERERQAELRKTKMIRYDDLVKYLTKLVQSRAEEETGRNFIDAYYRAGAYASKNVLNACHKLLKKLETKGHGPLQSIGEIETLVDDIYNAIRKDTLGPKEADHEFRAYHLRDGVFSP
jgi:hypothetical protein